jgi:hypothetical protein
MSIEIYLTRFDPSGEEEPKHPHVFRELERIAREVTEMDGEVDAVSVATWGVMARGRIKMSTIP